MCPLSIVCCPLQVNASCCFTICCHRLLRAALCILKLLEPPSPHGAAPSPPQGVNDVLDRLSRACVRRRYRELSVAVHPDKCSHEQAKEVCACLPFFHLCIGADVPLFTYYTHPVCLLASMHTATPFYSLICIIPRKLNQHQTTAVARCSTIRFPVLHGATPTHPPHCMLTVVLPMCTGV